MCGQIFCNQCSSHYIDGVRACRLCHDQISERTLSYLSERVAYERYSYTQNDKRRRVGTNTSSSMASQPLASDQYFTNMKKIKRSALNYEDDTNVNSSSSLPSTMSSVDIEQRERDKDINLEKMVHVNNLQNRASTHLEAIVSQLVDNSLFATSSQSKKVEDNTSLINSDTINHQNIQRCEQWKTIIVGLVRDVVSSVDPNVKRGDSLDIRPYVKIKIIPGGTLEECMYIDGVVYRKAVSHKKMMDEVLLLYWTLLWHIYQK